MTGEGPKRYFTVAEAEALIPKLGEIVASLMEAQSRVKEIQETIQTEQEHIMVSGGFAVDRALWRERKSELDKLVELLQDGMTEILELGAVPKDLQLGLVDFPHLLNGEEVNLCWRYGEKGIRYWHGLDEGYPGRKALFPE